MKYLILFQEYFNEVTSVGGNLYKFCNYYFYSLFIIGCIVGLSFPILRYEIIQGLRHSISEGSIGVISSFYNSGNVPLAFIATFSFNLIFGTIVYILFPSFFLPFSAMIVLSIRLIIWGVALTPYDSVPIIKFFISIPTLILEGQAYIIITYSIILITKNFLTYKKNGFAHRRLVLQSNYFFFLKILYVVIILLFCGALYEAISVTLFVKFIS